MNFRKIPEYFLRVKTFVEEDLNQKRGIDSYKNSVISKLINGEQVRLEDASKRIDEIYKKWHPLSHIAKVSGKGEIELVHGRYSSNK